jgi:hypothetical protein
VARRSAAPLVALAACALLAACLRAPPAAVAQPQADQAPPELVLAAPEPDIAASGPNADADGQAALAAPGPAVDDDPRRLIGLDQNAVQRLLGTPSFMRKDLPAQLWRYATGGCVLDIFLYGRSSSGPFVVRHLSARAASAAPIAAPQAAAEINPRACLAELLRARAAPASG